MSDLKIFTDNIEPTALNQIYTLVKQPAFADCKVRIMPDVHAGAGCVIGFTADLGDKVIPNIVGVDIGCGMLTVELGKEDIVMNMVCKCGSKKFFTEEHDNQTGLYCSACGKWQKWLKKDEIRLFNHGVKVENASLLERLKARIEESAIKVSTVKAPHTYMKAVGTRELEKILEEELGNEDTKRHTC